MDIGSYFVLQFTQLVTNIFLNLILCGMALKCIIHHYSDIPESSDKLYHTLLSYLCGYMQVCVCVCVHPNTEIHDLKY